MHDPALAEIPADPAVTAALWKVLEAAGARGATAGKLGLEKPAGPRAAALARMVNQARVVESGNRFLLPVLPDTVASKIRMLTADPAGEGPRLWRKKELARVLAPAEKEKLDAALARLEDTREVLRVQAGRRGEYFLSAEALRRWLEGEPAARASGTVPTGAPADASAELLAAYTEAVRVSGGFPDVKLSTLRASLPGETAATFGERLRMLWYEGRVTLSLGDWSLASDEMRAAAIELDGERYLLVRFEDPAAESLPA